jgi:hypothetical protein
MTGMPPEVRAVFDAAPRDARAGMEQLRTLILDVGREPGVGPVTEALRWGEAAYLAPKGSTLRIGVPKSGGRFALFAHCRTTLIAEFREMTGGAFRTEVNRAVLFDRQKDVDPVALGPLIRRALTWHLEEPT